MVERSLGNSSLGVKTAVELQVFIRHNSRCESLARSLIGEIGVGAAEITIGVESANRIGETIGVIFLEVDRGFAPDFAEAGDVVSHDRAPRQRGFEWGQAERLIARGGRV